MVLEHEKHEALENWAAVILILIIIVFTASFELCTSGILKWLKKQDLQGLQNMLNAVFKELTILGFISLLLFSTVRSGIAQKLNDKVFGQTETEKVAIKEAAEKGQIPAPPTTLQELFEDVHILIFVIMVMYIVEAAILLLVGRRTIHSFAALDRQSKEELAGALSDVGSQNEGGLPVITQHRQEVLVFYGLRERFLNPPISVFTKPHEKSFPFSNYLAANYTELLVELIELPVTSLLIVLIMTLLLRPFMILQGVSFLLFLVAIAVGLFVLTLGAWIVVHRGYRLLIPNPERIRHYLMLSGEAANSSMSGKNSVGSRIHSSQYTEVFRAPIDALPVYAKTLCGTANRIERQVPGGKLTVFRRCLQLLLFLNAVFTAVVLHDAISIVPSEIGLWWTHRLWSYPLTLGIVLVNLTCWVSLIREFMCMTCLDCQVNETMIHEVEEAMESEMLQRNVEILRVMFHNADHAHTTGSPERTAAEMERVALEFARLPSQTKNLVTLIFATVSRYHDRLGEPEMKGVVTKTDMREAFRLMGWTADRISTYILTSWFDERDVNKHGLLTFTGFVQVIMLSTSLGDALKDPHETRLSRRERVRALFEALDENHDDELSVIEIMKMLEGLTPPATEKEIQHLIERLSGGGSSVTFAQLMFFVESVDPPKPVDVG